MCLSQPIICLFSNYLFRAYSLLGNLCGAEDLGAYIPEKNTETNKKQKQNPC